MNPEVAEWRLPSPALSPEAKEWSPAAAMFVSVEAVIGNQVCEGEVQKVDRGTTFADVLQCTRAAEKEGLSRITDEVKVKIKNSLTERSVYVAELNWPVMEVMQAQGMNIVEFSFPGIDPTPLPSPTVADGGIFARMMAQSAQDGRRGSHHKIKEKQPDNKKARLFNEMAKILNELEGKFSKADVTAPNGSAYQIAEYVTDVVWDIDNSMVSFVKNAGGKANVPDVFLSLMQPKGMDGIQKRVYINDFKTKKEARRTLASARLQAHHRIGNNLVIGAKCLDDPAWAPFKNDFVNLVNAISRVLLNLERNNETTKRLHASMQNIQGELNSLTKLPAIIPPADRVREDYMPLDRAIIGTEDLKLICANDFLPTYNKPHRTHKWLNEVQTSTACMKFVTKSSRRSQSAVVVFICSLPPDYEEKPSDYDCRVAALVKEVQDSRSIFHSRAERAHLHQQLNLLSGIGGWGQLGPGGKSALLRLILDDDSADAAKVEKEFQILINFAVDSGDDDFIADLRQIGNNGSKTKFTVFFGELKKMLEEKNLVAAEDRRHNAVPHLAVQTGGRQRITDANGYAPEFISIRQLIDDVTERVEPGTPIPSRSTVAMAFSHPNPREGESVTIIMTASMGETENLMQEPPVQLLEGFACSNSDCPLTGVVSFSSVLGSPKCFIMVKMDMWKCNGVHPKAHIRRAAGVI